MEKLRFSDSVFEAGAGRIYEILIKISAPALFAGILVIAVINTGMMTQVSTYPEWMKVILLGIIMVYVVPGLFIFPTVWMLRSWKTRDLRDSYVMAGQIKKVEEGPRKYTIIGNIVEKGSGVKSAELEIPKAYENMDLIKRAARYR